MPIAPTETNLGANIPREAAGGSYNSGFNFDFLRLAIELSKQPVNSRHHGRNILNDQSISPIVRDHISALRKETLDCRHDILRVRIAQKSRHRDLVHCQSFSFHLSAP